MIDKNCRREPRTIRGKRPVSGPDQATLKTGEGPFFIPHEFAR